MLTRSRSRKRKFSKSPSCCQHEAEPINLDRPGFISSEMLPERGTYQNSSETSNLSLTKRVCSHVLTK
jgi:hypothetical protein